MYSCITNRTFQSFSFMQHTSGNSILLIDLPQFFYIFKNSYMKSRIILSLLALRVSWSVFAQQDAEGCKDHPMFSRMPAYYLYDCSSNFASLDVFFAANNVQQHEGTRTKIDYRYNSEGQGKYASWLQVIKNYENAVNRLGGKKLFSDAEHASYLVKRVLFPLL